jgi:hypothetical protein
MLEGVSLAVTFVKTHRWEHQSRGVQEQQNGQGDTDYDITCAGYAKPIFELLDGASKPFVASRLSVE